MAGTNTPCPGHDHARARGPAHAAPTEDTMKKNIHPKMVPCKVYCEGQVVLETYSTKPEVHVDVWSGNHPFYTGQQRFIDTEGRVEKFQKRFGTSYRK
jgi:large subunit ribosomal protein L31